MTPLPPSCLTSEAIFGIFAASQGHLDGLFSLSWSQLQQVGSGAGHPWPKPVALLSPFPVQGLVPGLGGDSQAGLV